MDCSPSVFLNRVELAELLEVSVVTLDTYLRRWSDFPVVSRGGPGVSYAFDPIAVQAFLTTKTEEAARAKQARRDAIGQLRLDDEAFSPPAPNNIRPARRMVASELERLGVDLRHIVIAKAVDAGLNEAQAAEIGAKAYARIEQAARTISNRLAKLGGA